uniref:Uncharacterized protein n=1 Tax=Quercus lobata TaxID=97700 RepID=A0A7N2N2R8_QUELO
MQIWGVHGSGRVGFGPDPPVSGGRRRDPKPTAGVTRSGRFWVRVGRSVLSVAGSCKRRRNLLKCRQNLQKPSRSAPKIAEISLDLLESRRISPNMVQISLGSPQMSPDLTKSRLNSSDLTQSRLNIWGLPFENMIEDIGKDIDSKIGRVLEVDKRAMQTDQAKFLRIRVEVQIDKPLRRGGYIKNDEAGGVLKVGGEKEKLKEQSVTEKGCSASMAVDSGVGEKCVAGSRSSPELVVGGGAEEENGMVIMVEAAPLNMAKSLVTSNHGE